MSSLEIDDVSVDFQGLKAIDSVSETIITGEILGLIGPNGAGKTTLVNVMTGFQSPTVGTVKLLGQTIEGSSTHQLRRKGVARTFQGGRLFREMSVCENVETAGLGLGLSRKQATIEALELIDWMGLSDKANVLAGALPYTDERRVGIARALMQEPEMLLVDEPTSSLDPKIAVEMMELIKKIAEELKIPVLCNIHNIDLAKQFANRILGLQDGKKKFDDVTIKLTNEVLQDLYKFEVL